MGAASAAALILASIQPPPSVDLPADTGDEIVVTARRNGAPIDPVEIYRRRCFDPTRRTGQASIRTDGDWRALSPEERARVGITQATAPAAAMRAMP